MSESIAEFLLERVAEDEHDAHAHECVCSEDQDGHFAFCSQRVWRECDAKRRLVSDYLHLSEMKRGALHSHAHFVMRAMAGVYSNHPDFKPEWRL